MTLTFDGSTLGSKGTGRSATATIAAALMSVGIALPTTVAEAKECPSRKGHSQLLPDCRSYEQVSPVEKNLNEALGGATAGSVQSSPGGEMVTFTSLAPFPGVAGSSQFPTYLSTRVAGGGSFEWSTQGLVPPSGPGTSSELLALTESLGESIVEAVDEAVEPVLAPGRKPDESNLYVHNDATGSYRLLAPGPGEAIFADASSNGSQILFEDRANLVLGSDAIEGDLNLYEWDEGRLILIAADAVAGIAANLENTASPPSQEYFYTQNTISRNGSRVFYTSLSTQHIYMREPQAEKTIEVSHGPAAWRASTPDGAYVFYTEEGKLYRFNVNAALSGRPEEEAHAREMIANGVYAMLGASEDGSYAYFDDGATLYEWHDDVVTAIAHLPVDRADNWNWQGFASTADGEPPGGERSSRVTPDGRTLLFSTGSTEVNELLRYYAPTGMLTCVSCNPSGAPATTGAFLTGEIAGSEAEGIRVDPRVHPFLTRNLSEDGSRVFFQTAEALVPQDTNGRVDVYEWENGHIYLISSGQSPGSSFFGDASASGNDVFFFTHQSLVGQDQDINQDLYDARVEGGIAAQNPVTTPPCVGEECHGAIATAPGFGPPASATFSGAGNLAPQSQAVLAKKPAPKQKPRSKTKRSVKLSVRRRA
jgi:hypothetical protein